ncbi:MAG: DUF2274 domain-containing protein [Sphingomicrobium sp.]
MPQIKLARLPERTPAKLSISLPPDLHQALIAYGAFYADSSGHEEPVGEFVPAMLAAFLESDRAFQAARRLGTGNDARS